MARKTFPRKREAHEIAADHWLAKHEAVTGCKVELPVPVEAIVEHTAGLSILWEPIPEPEDAMILGALSPRTKTIVLNETHLNLLSEVMGPERFTLAHELGHWVYDAENPDQLSLDIGGGGDDVFCYHREHKGLEETAQIREINANGFAAALLLPKSLLKGVDVGDVLKSFRSTAHSWGVSQTTLRIRLEKLGLIDDTDAAMLQM